MPHSGASRAGSAPAGTWSEFWFTSIRHITATLCLTLDELAIAWLSFRVKAELAWDKLPVIDGRRVMPRINIRERVDTILADKPWQHHISFLMWNATEDDTLSRLSEGTCSDKWWYGRGRSGNERQPDGACLDRSYREEWRERGSEDERQTAAQARLDHARIGSDVRRLTGTVRALHRRDRDARSKG